MATTYTLISSNVLSSNAVSITFTSIPNTYTDLVVRISARSDYSNDSFQIQPNTTFDTNNSSTYLQGNGSAASSGRKNAYLGVYVAPLDLSTDTANTFGSYEIYIPNYNSSNYKPMSNFGVTENNATTAYVYPSAMLWRDTSAITSVKLAAENSYLLAGSSFYLYGIKNS